MARETRRRRDTQADRTAAWPGELECPREVVRSDIDAGPMGLDLAADSAP